LRIISFALSERRKGEGFHILGPSLYEIFFCLDYCINVICGTFLLSFEQSWMMLDVICAFGVCCRCHCSAARTLIIYVPHKSEMFMRLVNLSGGSTAITAAALPSEINNLRRFVRRRRYNTGRLWPETLTILID